MISHWQHPKDFVGAGQAQSGIGGARALQHVAMGEDDALGGAGGAGSKAHEGRVRQARRERRLGIVEPCEAQAVSARIFQGHGRARLRRAAAVVEDRA